MGIDELPAECWFCHVEPSCEDELLTCTRCGVAKYCNTGCQKQHWKVHKALSCLCSMDVTTNPVEILPESTELSIKLSHLCVREKWYNEALVPSLNPGLAKLLETKSFAKCLEKKFCMKCGSRKKLQPCMACDSVHWCFECDKDVFDLHFSQCSNLVKAKTVLAMLDKNPNVTAFASPWTPPRDFAPPNLPQNWSDYFDIRGPLPPSLPPVLKGITTCALSLPMTLATALSWSGLSSKHVLGRPTCCPLAPKSTLTVHVPNASSGVELIGTVKWVEALAWMHDISHIDLLLIGSRMPENTEKLSRTIYLKSTSSMVVDMDADNGPSITVSAFHGTPQAYMSSSKYCRPDLVVAFNPILFRCIEGLAPYLLSHTNAGVPVFWTASSYETAMKDSKCFQRLLCADFSVHPQQLPLGSEIPFIDPTTLCTVAYPNKYGFLVAGGRRTRV